MSDNTWSDGASSDYRTPALKCAIAEAGDEMSATIGLPTKSNQGSSRLRSCLYSVMGDESRTRSPSTGTRIGQQQRGCRTFPLRRHLSGSSAPAYGWASWRDRTDLLLADTWPDLEVDGWAHIPGDASGSGLPDEEAENVLYEPRTWVELARLLAGAVRGQELPAQTGQTFQ